MRVVSAAAFCVTAASACGRSRHWSLHSTAAKPGTPWLEVAFAWQAVMIHDLHPVAPTIVQMCILDGNAYDVKCLEAGLERDEDLDACSLLLNNKVGQPGSLRWSLLADAMICKGCW